MSSDYVVSVRRSSLCRRCQRSVVEMPSIPPSRPVCIPYRTSDESPAIFGDVLKKIFVQEGSTRQSQPIYPLPVWSQCRRSAPIICASGFLAIQTPLAQCCLCNEHRQYRSLCEPSPSYFAGLLPSSRNNCHCPKISSLFMITPLSPEERQR